MQHAPTYTPYDESSIKYYAVPISVGTAYVCTSAAYQTITPSSGTVTYSWSASGHLTPTSQTGSSNYYSVSKAYNGSSYIAVSINSSCSGTTVTARKPVQAGPETAEFSITPYPSYCSSPGYVLDFVAELSGVNYSWTVNGGTLLGGQGTQAIYALMNSSSMAVHCYVTGTSATNCYGPAGISSIYINECFGFSALATSPNPASNSLSIELEEPEENKPVSVELTNNFGEAVRSLISYKNKFEINTETLPEGLYILKVFYNGRHHNRRIVIEK